MIDMFDIIKEHATKCGYTSSGRSTDNIVIYDGKLAIATINGSQGYLNIAFWDHTKRLPDKSRYSGIGEATLFMGDIEWDTKLCKIYKSSKLSSKILDLH